IRTILAEQSRPHAVPGAWDRLSQQRIAWKTGTSYGFRDAWCLGTSDHYTVGVWLGRPDGSPIPGYYGRHAAAPLLFDIFAILPTHTLSKSHTPPETVKKETICWPTGQSPKKNSTNCPLQRTAWILEETIPPTLPDRLAPHKNYLETLWLNKKNGLQINMHCPTPQRIKKEVTRWPTLLQPWISHQMLIHQRPDPDPSCPPGTLQTTTPLKILGLPRQSILHPLPDKRTLPLRLTTTPQQGPLYWRINQKKIHRTQNNQPLHLELTQPGAYRITVINEQGHFDSIQFHFLM
ncbi:hypothetical protein ACQZV8_21465, partial [Magnetococcales bacterium HHB-1]